MSEQGSGPEAAAAIAREWERRRKAYDETSEAERARSRSEQRHIRPAHDNIVIRITTRDVTRGGIFIPESALAARKNHFEIVEVIAVGPGRIMHDGERVPVECKPGDRVILTRGANVVPIAYNGADISGREAMGIVSWQHVAGFDERPETGLS